MTNIAASNGLLLRDYLSKRTDLRGFSHAELQRVADEVNTRPRKTPYWQTPAERLNKLLAQAH